MWSACVSDTDQPFPFHARLSAGAHNCSSRRQREEAEVLRSFWLPSCLRPACVCSDPGSAPQGSARPGAFSPRLSAAPRSHVALLRNNSKLCLEGLWCWPTAVQHRRPAGQTPVTPLYRAAQIQEISAGVLLMGLQQRLERPLHHLKAWFSIFLTPKQMIDFIGNYTRSWGGGAGGDPGGEQLMLYLSNNR